MIDLRHAIPGLVILFPLDPKIWAAVAHLGAFSISWFALLSVLDVAYYWGCVLCYRSLIGKGWSPGTLASVHPETCIVLLRQALGLNIGITIVAWVVLYYYYFSPGLWEQLSVLVALFSTALFFTYRHTMAKLHRAFSK